MSSKKGAMKKKLENMHLGKRINYGYKMVITMMHYFGTAFDCGHWCVVFQYVKLCKQGKCF